MIGLAERGWIPQPLLRWGIRRRLAHQLGECLSTTDEERQAWRKEWADGALAPDAHLANAQHYEVPAAYFERVLGDYLKYSGAYWPEGVRDLSVAEAKMLELYEERAQLDSNQKILDLGCGWGSLSLWLAQRHPEMEIDALSNSASQGEFIRGKSAGWPNQPRHRVMDVNQLELEGSYDRILSIEMFEHLRDHRRIFSKLAQALRPGGKIFIHVFAHRKYFYPFDRSDTNAWMARNFFSGGIMPSQDLLPSSLPPELTLEKSWWLSGEHYAKSAEAWVRRHEAAKAEILELFRTTQREVPPRILYERWRLFHLACAELFGYRGGSEWGVAHYRIQRSEDV